MSNKQSSVLFLWQELKHWLPERYTVDDSVKILSILNQAVSMHEDEITKAWEKGDGEFDKVAEEMSLEYYNETFGE